MWNKTRYSIAEKRSWLLRFRANPYETIQILKDKGGHRWLVQKLQQKL